MKKDSMSWERHFISKLLRGFYNIKSLKAKKEKKKGKEKEKQGFFKLLKSRQSWKKIFDIKMWKCSCHLWSDYIPTYVKQIMVGMGWLAAEQVMFVFLLSCSVISNSIGDLQKPSKIFFGLQSLSKKKWTQPVITQVLRMHISSWDKRFQGGSVQWVYPIELYSTDLISMQSKQEVSTPDKNHLFMYFDWAIKNSI